MVNGDKIKGVSWSSTRQKWYAYIGIHKKKIYLGRYDRQEDAERARRDAEMKYADQLPPKIVDTGERAEGVYFIANRWESCIGRNGKLVRIGRFLTFEEALAARKKAEKELPPTPREKNYGIHPGDHIGYWEILEQRGCRFLCRCICGKEREMNVTMLLSGKSHSCGCKRGELFSDRQKKGKNLGNKIMTEIHSAGLTPQYISSTVSKNSTTGIKGVNRLKNGRYRAYIMVDRKQTSLGLYDQIEDAAAARKAGEEKYFAPRAEKVREIINREKKGHDKYGK